MKKVLYRYKYKDSPEDEGFIYGSVEVPNQTAITETLCIRNEFGENYIRNFSDYYIFEIYKIIEQYDV